jgi:chemotaxis protein CheD
MDPRSHYLFPCTLFAHRQAHQVTTILGSCVAVCLWDSGLGLGGMNHYMLALWNGDGLPTPKYGNIAIEKLIRAMLDRGADRGRMVAKVFGGARVISSDPEIWSVGERNIALAREVLGREAIPIQAMDVGGTNGRKIVFDTASGAVLMYRLRS